MVANTALFGNHLDRDVNKIVFDEYITHAHEYVDIFHVLPAPKGNHYTEAELSPFGPLRFVAEGDAVTFDLPVEGHKKTIYFSQWALGMVITKQMYRDDLTGNWKKAPKVLAQSASQTIDGQAFDQFNRGFGTHLAWDGQFVFDTDHSTLKSGETISNDGVAASLTETSLRAGIEYFLNLRGESGFPLDIFPSVLLVPTSKVWAANQLVNNPKIVGSMNNDFNMVSNANNPVSQLRVHTSRYLTSDTAYFLMAPEHGFYVMFKENLELTSTDDFYTSSALFKVMTEFSPFVMDYKGSWGNEGA
jgi:phage major head subunit gpT-like protein